MSNALTPIAKVIPIQPVQAAHAVLSASGSKKWMICTRSARLEALFADTKSDYSEEGTYMHALLEYLLIVYLGRKPEFASIDQIEGYDKFHTDEIADAVKAAFDYVVKRIEYARSVCKDPLILLEQRLDYSPWVKEGFGTGDILIITDAYIEVLDLKGGKGVAVNAKGNSQFRLYMLGALNQYGHIYGPTKMIGTVIQPRLNNYDSEELDVAELLEWAADEVVPAAQLAWEGKGDFVAGSHCSEGFCKARATCSARAEHNLELARQDFALTAPELLTDEQIAKVLEKSAEAIKWMGDVKEFALEQAIAGREFPGFKLVEGRSTRSYANQDAVAAALRAAGFSDAVIYERSLLGITAMEKAIGKKKFAELLSTLVVKPSGKPTLAPVTDTREAFRSSVETDFSVQ